MKMLITGGCKNGKSLYAQKTIEQISGNGIKYYIATMKPQDDEDKARIIRHQNEREGCGFTTIEQPFNIEEVVNKCEENSSVLLDSTTALLMNEMFLSDGSVNKLAHIKIIDGLILLTEKVSNIIIVSDWIYSDAEKYGELTEHYKYALAQIDIKLAQKLDTVCEVTFSNLIFHKGENIL